MLGRNHNGLNITKISGVLRYKLGEVAASISDSVIGVFRRLNLSGRTMVQPVSEMSTSGIFWEGGGR